MKRMLTKDIENWKKSNNRKPLILLGARQVGKSFLISEFARENFAKVHVFNFETDTEFGHIFKKNINPKRIIQDLSLLTERTIDLNNDLIFFDEIQCVPEARSK